MCQGRGSDIGLILYIRRDLQALSSTNHHRPRLIPVVAGQDNSCSTLFEAEAIVSRAGTG